MSDCKACYQWLCWVISLKLTHSEWGVESGMSHLHRDLGVLGQVADRCATCFTSGTIYTCSEGKLRRCSDGVRAIYGFLVETKLAFHNVHLSPCLFFFLFSVAVISTMTKSHLGKQTGFIFCYSLQSTIRSHGRNLTWERGVRNWCP